MREDHETVHVQWFEHSSKTLAGELGHSQELFLTDVCDTLDLSNIIGTVRVHYIKPDQSLADVRPHDFFYRYKPSDSCFGCSDDVFRYMWDSFAGKFTNVDEDALAASTQEQPPDNCPACQIAEKFDQGLQPEKIHLGVRWHGVEYHLDDFIFIKADEGPCHIGHVTKFIHSREGHGNNVNVVVRLLGRTDRIGTRPDTTLKDEVCFLVRRYYFLFHVHAYRDICFTRVTR